MGSYALGPGVLGSDKFCRVCGDELACIEMGGGSVWSCDVHGVREWQFGAGAHWGPMVRGPPAKRAAQAPARAAPAPPAAPGSVVRAAPRWTSLAKLL